MITTEYFIVLTDGKKEKITKFCESGDFWIQSVNCFIVIISFLFAVKLKKHYHAFPTFLNVDIYLDLKNSKIHYK